MTRRIINGYLRCILGIEIDAGNGVKLTQRLFYSDHQNLPECLFMLKLHFCLCGMDIDIDCSGIGLKVDIISGFSFAAINGSKAVITAL